MASLNGWRSASTDEPVSAGELARLGATMASRVLALLLLCGGALPHRKLIRSSLRMVLRRFFTQANMSCNSAEEWCIHQLAMMFHHLLTNTEIIFVSLATMFRNPNSLVMEEQDPPYYGVDGLFARPDQSFSDGPLHFLWWWKTT